MNRYVENGELGCEGEREHNSILSIHNTETFRWNVSTGDLWMICGLFLNIDNRYVVDKNF